MILELIEKSFKSPGRHVYTVMKQRQCENYNKKRMCWCYRSKRRSCIDVDVGVIITASRVTLNQYKAHVTVGCCFQLVKDKAYEKGQVILGVFRNTFSVKKGIIYV